MHPHLHHKAVGSNTGNEASAVPAAPMHEPGWPCSEAASQEGTGYVPVVPVISVSRPLDYEQIPNGLIYLTVMAKDAGNPPLNSTVPVIIEVFVSIWDCGLCPARIRVKNTSQGVRSLPGCGTGFPMFSAVPLAQAVTLAAPLASATAAVTRLLRSVGRRGQGAWSSRRDRGPAVAASWPPGQTPQG